jgi:hypothetical protein
MCAQATEPIKWINVLLICYTLPEFGMAMEMAIHLFVLTNLPTYYECICNYTLKYTLHKEKACIVLWTPGGVSAPFGIMGILIQYQIPKAQTTGVEMLPEIEIDTE